LKKFFSVGSVVLRVTFFNGQRQAAHFLAHLDAKRAGVELVQRQALALQIDRGLSRSVALHALWLSETLFEQHDGAQHKAQGFKEDTDDRFHGGEW
jgi:hypothetical protein